LTIDWPLTVVDSMCSMLSTVVVRTRLVLRGDPAFHLFRVEAGELPGDRDHRNVDARKDVRSVVRRMRTGLASRISRARTTKVYGRCSADPDNPHAVFDARRPGRGYRHPAWGEISLTRYASY